ncbi:hypothetical protein Cni_G14217 [Canna indica]|uniref:Uncharacterized protein n=1 Tax=Canna indica TaxID=4628 RepID=A0AAQ3QDR9_9LILI|nr:hypothetical protein Cni_G14217 [Canna indica]
MAAYKHFVKSCSVLVDDSDVGTLREVRVVSDLPTATSTERLEILNDESDMLNFWVVGEDHPSPTTTSSPRCNWFFD